MADIPPINPNPPGAPMGAEPMKKTTGKVAPKKETVAINLPPNMAGIPGAPGGAVPPPKIETVSYQCIIAVDVITSTPCF